MLIITLLLLLLLVQLLLLHSSPSKNEGPILWLPTNEGITSQIVQIERLWGKAQSVNRSIIIRNFECTHFSDVNRVNICNLINFPGTINCTNDDLSVIVKKHDCHLIQAKETWSSHPLTYMLSKNVIRDPNFDVRSVDCIAGFIHESEGKVPVAKVLPKFDNLSVSTYYDIMFPEIKKVLNISTQEFVTMHWRRGDQLESRCPEQLDQRFKQQRDVSVNCHSVEEFISVTASLLKQENLTNQSVIVATNELSHEQLLQLHKAGYKTVSLLKSSQQFQHLNSVDLFMIDLLMMIEAKWLFQWGVSQVHDLVNHLLHRQVINQKKTYLNGKLIVGAHA